MTPLRMRRGMYSNMKRHIKSKHPNIFEKECTYITPQTDTKNARKTVQEFVKEFKADLQISNLRDKNENEETDCEENDDDRNKDDEENDDVDDRNDLGKNIDTDSDYRPSESSDCDDDEIERLEKEIKDLCNKPDSQHTSKLILNTKIF